MRRQSRQLQWGLGDPRFDPAGTGSLHACSCVAMRRQSRRRQQGLGDPRLASAGTGSLHACCCVAMRRQSRRRQQGIKSFAHSSDERTVATISTAHPMISDRPPKGVIGPSQRGPSKANHRVSRKTKRLPGRNNPPPTQSHGSRRALSPKIKVPVRATSGSRPPSSRLHASSTLQGVSPTHAPQMRPKRPQRAHKWPK